MKFFSQLVVMILILIFVSGCTVHFKTTDTELEAEVVQTFHLEALGLFELPDRGIVIEPVRLAQK